MARKKSGSVKKKAAAPGVAAKKGVKTPGKSNKVLLIVLAVFVVLTVMEIYFVTLNSIRQSKRPAYVNSWAVQYKGYTSATECGDYLYVNDQSSGDVYKTNKATGSLEKVLSIPEGTAGVVADSKDDIYILTRTNEVLVVDGKTYKTVKRIKPEGMGNIVWLDVDSKDNFFLVDSKTNEIVKYDHDFKRLLKFGGPNADRGSLNAVGKIFVGGKDNIYALNSYKPDAIEIKIFDDAGKFIRSWPITKIKSFDAMTNLAITAGGDVYINSYKEGRIYAFSATGKFLGSFDSDQEKRFQIINGAVLITGGKNGLLYIFASKIGVLKTIAY